MAKTIFFWSVPGEVKTNYEKVFIMTETEDLKSGIEIGLTFQRTAFGKWVLFIMSLRLGKNTWEPQDRKIIKRNILMTYLKVKCRSKEAGRGRLEVASNLSIN